MVTALVVVAPVGATEADTTGASVDALFEGELLDLGVDWGEATACLIWDDVNVAECFRTEAEMDERIAELEKELDLGEGSARASQCSGDVRLYDGVVYTGSVLNLRNRLAWINLSAYGFSNRTSSFKIGPCSSVFADYNNGYGSLYPTSGTQAWDVAPVMATGWSNRVSSIYIG
ncbi:MAG: hypothetical protein R2823_10805 [Acidimicrobiia bacterium]